MAANLLKHKRSAVPNKAPGIGDLALGELAINTYDGAIYLKRNGLSGEEIVRIDPSASAPVEASDYAIQLDNFIGDGTTTQFTLSAAPIAEQFVFITINGVDQQTDSYSLTGSTLTLSEAPANGDTIEVRTVSIQVDSVIIRDYKSYVYQPSTSTTTFQGADVNSAVLEYDIEKVEVYLNGAKLVNGYDYTATDGTSIVLETSITNGDTLEVVSLSKASFTDTSAIRPNGIELTTTDANQVIDTFPASAYRTAKYIISLSHPTAGYHAEELLVLHDGSSVYTNSSSQVLTNLSLGTFNGSISNGSVQLTITPANTNTSVKLQRITVTV